MLSYHWAVGMNAKRVTVGTRGYHKMQEIIEYFFDVFVAIIYTLRFDPRVYVAVVIQPNGEEVILGIVLLAGVSRFLGQSVILFINRVRRGRFVFSLLTNGLVFVFSKSSHAFLHPRFDPRPGMQSKGSHGRSLQHAACD